MRWPHLSFAALDFGTSSRHVKHSTLQHYQYITIEAEYRPYSFSGSTWTGGAGAKKLPNRLDRLVVLVGVTDGAWWVLEEGTCEVVVLLLFRGDRVSECSCRTGGGLRKGC